LNASYAKTRQILLSRLVFGGNTVYMDTGFSTSEINKQKLALELQTLDNIISTLKSGLLDHNERIYSVAVTHYAELFETWSFPTFYRYGAYLIRSIAELDSRFPMNAALTSLKAFGLSGKGKLIQDDMVTLFNGIMKTFAQSIMPDKREHDENDLVSRAKQYIYAHFSEPISLALIAEVVGVSPSYLSSIFHKSVNESYIRFLTRIRMEEAAKLLQSKPLKKIVDVAEMVGYVSVKHFSYVFKQHFRMPPGEYQEKL
jgi:two-component system response regulator YesN